MEYADINPAVELYQNYNKQHEELESARTMLADADKAMQAMARDESQAGRARSARLTATLVL